VFMARKRLQQVVAEIMRENDSPPAEHVATFEQPNDPCVIKMWVKRLAVQVTYPESLVLQFVLQWHTMDVARFPEYLASHGVSDDDVPDPAAMFRHVLPAHSILSELCRRYVSMPVCTQSDAEKLKKQLILQRLRGHL